MFRVLSLDGGGIRGAFIAACLARLEQDLQRRITDYFDMVVGTSTGGIIALALALEEPAERILHLFRQRGAEIFSRRASADLLEQVSLSLIRRRLPNITNLRRSKYSQVPLRRALTEVYGDKTIGDISCCRVVIPAVDLILGRTVTFKTPHQPDFVRDRTLRVVDVALTTSAAPVYFPQASIAEHSAYTDGGLWANNPSIVAYAEAVKIAQVCKRPNVDPEFGPETIFMLSIGTGRPQYYAKPAPTDDGLLWWGPRIFEVAAGAQSQGIHFQASYLMGTDRYRRIDFDMPADPWALDDIDALNSLVQFGEQGAIDHFASLRRTFFVDEKTAFQPYR
jgi:predicted acylesterase/phospholipase RssA